MLWGRRRKPKTKNEAPTRFPQHVYLFECSIDPDVVIAGITYNLRERATARGYGRLLWSCQLSSRKACADAERRFMRATQAYAVGDDFRGKTTWTEARRMSAGEAIEAWRRAIGKKHANTCTTYQ